MPPKFITNALVSRLINEAQTAAVKRLEGAEVTDKSLRELARAVKENILAQAVLGEWKELGITFEVQMQNLVVIVRRGRLGEPPIVIKYDWSKTDLHTLLVEPTSRRGRN